MPTTGHSGEQHKVDPLAKYGPLTRNITEPGEQNTSTEDQPIPKKLAEKEWVERLAYADSVASAAGVTHSKKSTDRMEESLNGL